MNRNLHVNTTNVQMKGFALGLALKQRWKAIRKSPIEAYLSLLERFSFVLDIKTVRKTETIGQHKQEFWLVDWLVMIGLSNKAHKYVIAFVKRATSSCAVFRHVFIYHWRALVYICSSIGWWNKAQTNIVLQVLTKTALKTSLVRDLSEGMVVWIIFVQFFSV